MFTGDIIIRNRGALPDFYFKMPAYYFEASQRLNKQKGDWRVFFLPQNGFAESIGFNWGYSGKDVARRLIYKPSLLILGANFEPQFSNLINLVYENFHYGSTTTLSRLLGLLNTGKILQRNDINWKRKIRP